MYEYMLKEFLSAMYDITQIKLLIYKWYQSLIADFHNAVLL